MRERRRARVLRRLRLGVLDARDRKVRRRIARQVRNLNQRNESQVLEWIEKVSEFDNSGLNFNDRK
jgi:hypothetical protein